MSNEDELGELAMRNIQWLAFPPTELEADLFAHVKTLPHVVVVRPPREDLLAAGMIAYDCHRNCANQVANDPNASSRHVTGWLPYADDFILHSVVVINGNWVCLTPQLVDAPSRFSFIPDGNIEWREDVTGSYRPFRGGTEIPDALRRDPERHIRMRDQFMALVEGGMSPFDAREAVETANKVSKGSV